MISARHHAEKERVIIRANIAVNNLLDNNYYQFSLMPGRNVTFELVMSVF
jgi:hypothetical protein